MEFIFLLFRFFARALFNVEVGAAPSTQTFALIIAQRGMGKLKGKRRYEQRREINDVIFA